MTENEKTDIKEIQTEEQSHHRKPNGTMIKKIRGKIFVTEIFFDPDSKDSFQDKLLKVIQSKWK